MLQRTVVRVCLHVWTRGESTLKSQKKRIVQFPCMSFKFCFVFIYSF